MRYHQIASPCLVQMSKEENPTQAGTIVLEGEKDALDAVGAQHADRSVHLVAAQKCEVSLCFCQDHHQHRQAAPHKQGLNDD